MSKYSNLIKVYLNRVSKNMILLMQILNNKQDDLTYTNAKKLKFLLIFKFISIDF